MLWPSVTNWIKVSIKFQNQNWLKWLMYQLYQWIHGIRGFETLHPSKDGDEFAVVPLMSSPKGTLLEDLVMIDELGTDASIFVANQWMTILLEKACWYKGYHDTSCLPSLVGKIESSVGSSSRLQRLPGARGRIYIGFPSQNPSWWRTNKDCPT